MIDDSIESRMWSLDGWWKIDLGWIIPFGITAVYSSFVITMLSLFSVAHKIHDQVWSVPSRLNVFEA